MISSIAIIEKEQAFATSSLDCCVHIWSLKNFVKLGSLILAQSNNLWKLNIDKSEKEQQKNEFSISVLKSINKYDENGGNNNKRSNAKDHKQETLSFARKIIKRGKLLRENNWQKDEYE